MSAEAWATLVTSVVVPLVLRILVHYFPWLADGADTTTAARRHARPTQAAPSAPETDPQEGAEGA